MRRFLTVTAVLLAMALVAAPSFSQVVANDAYQVNYVRDPIFQFPGTGLMFFPLLNDVVRVINTGQIGSPIDAGTNQGTVCADVYVFDTNQEMAACCSCPITANGLLQVTSENLLFNNLTAVFPDPAVVKIVADLPNAGNCNARSITSPVNGALRSWATHNQSQVVFTGGGVGFSPGPTMETESQSAPLTNTEAAFLGNACSFVQYLGSGRGRCICAVTDSNFPTS